MTELIAFRAIQGIGGGGLMVGAQTIIGDVVPPRDRGRYQGLFGAVFGVASVIGPLLGGLLVDNLSWHWIFYINIPSGIIALVDHGVVLPGALSRVHHVIDYLGAMLVALAATSLVLLTSLGRHDVRLGVGPDRHARVLGMLLLVAFMFAERRAAEPVIPLHLFANRVFSVCERDRLRRRLRACSAPSPSCRCTSRSSKGVSPTDSGLRLLPLMAGLLITSIGSGQVISRTGRYKIFPILGHGDR